MSEKIYIAITERGVDPYPIIIQDRAELEECLGDGSLSDGDKVYIAELYAVVKEETKTILGEVKDDNYNQGSK